MRPVTSKRLRWGICLVFFLVCLLAKSVVNPLFVAGAVLYTLLLLLAVVFGPFFATSARAEKLIRFSAVLWCAVALAALVPFGVSLKAAPGLPHFVPYVPGKPSSEVVEASERGELGGCCDFPIVPRWALVW